MHTSVTSTLTPILDPSERLLWSGQPRRGVRLSSQDIFLIPFSLMWGGFAIFWEVMAISTTAKAGSVGYIFPLFGIPFVCVGLYLIFGRFFVDAYLRDRTFYGVTNERIIIVSGLFFRQIKSLQLRTLTDVSLTERDDRSGTITFGPTLPFNNLFGGSSWPGRSRTSSPSFDTIATAKDVYDVIRGAQKGAA